MSVLTKVFVVLVTVFSIVLVALILPFVARTEDYRARLDDTSKALAAANATAQARQQEINAMQNTESNVVTQLKSSQDGLKRQIQTLSQQYADAEARAQGERATADQLKKDLSRLSAAQEQSSEILKKQQDELQVTRADNLKLRTQMIQWADRTNELESERDTLIRTVRQLQETNTAVSGQFSDLQKKWERIDRDTRAQLEGVEQTAGPFEPTIPIAGSVTAVQRVGGDTFVKINVGRNDQVESNMKFFVHRGGVLVGTLVVTSVDAQEAAGRITLARGEVQPGDAVYTGQQ